MAADEKQQAVDRIVKDLGCTKNEAKNAMSLAGGNEELARSIVQEYKKATHTTFAGGKSGQILEMPKSGYAAELEKMQKHSNANQTQKAVGQKTLTVYKNGILVDDKFTRLSESEREEMLKNISNTGEIPSKLFGIKQGDYLDIETNIKTDEIYKEDYPGISHSINIQHPTKKGEPISLGSGGPVFKLVVGETARVVRMGECKTLTPLQDFLKENGISGTLFCDKECVSWDDDPGKYNRCTLWVVGEKEYRP